MNLGKTEDMCNNESICVYLFGAKKSVFLNWICNRFLRAQSVKRQNIEWTKHRTKCRDGQSAKPGAGVGRGRVGLNDGKPEMCLQQKTFLINIPVSC